MGSPSGKSAWFGALLQDSGEANEGWRIVNVARIWRASEYSDEIQTGKTRQLKKALLPHTCVYFLNIKQNSNSNLKT